MLRIIPLVLPVSALLLVLGLMICPTTIDASSTAYALEGGVGTSTNMSVKLELDNVSNSDSATTLMTNAEVGRVNYLSQGFKVSASNVDSYSVYVQTAPGASNKLSNGKLVIDFVKENTTTNNFGDNTWGYAVDATGQLPESLAYSPVPDSNATNLNPAYTFTSTSENTGETKHLTLNFAAKFASDATPGHYGTDVLLSVAAGAYEVAVEFPKWTIHNMQEMNSTICANAKDNTTGQLTDLRDGKTYWVSKLADGNCWMVQNLDLDLKTDTILEPGTSDVPSNWSPETSTLTNANLTGGWNDSEATTKAYSYDPGMWVYSTPDKVVNCGNGVVEGLTSATCGKAEFGWEDVTNKTPSTDPNFYMYGYTADGKVINGNTYDAHYLIGNYYSWPAATAGQAKDVTANNDNATQSICPKGWTLPKAGRGDGSKSNEPLAEDKTFYKLLKEYGYTWEVGSNVTNDQPNFPISSSKTGYNLLKAPLYFLRGGNVVNSLLFYAGDRGGYWSSTGGASSSTQFAFTLYFDSADVYPSHYSSRPCGFSIRCVAR